MFNQVRVSSLPYPPPSPCTPIQSCNSHLLLFIAECSRLLTIECYIFSFLTHVLLSRRFHFLPFLFLFLGTFAPFCILPQLSSKWNSSPLIFVYIKVKFLSKILMLLFVSCIAIYTSEKIKYSLVSNIDMTVIHSLPQPVSFSYLVWLLDLQSIQSLGLCF